MKPMKKNKIIQKKHKWSEKFKIKHFGKGEWIKEADLICVKYMGYKALIIRKVFKQVRYAKKYYFGGYFCGYVQIPKNHIYFSNTKLCYELECHGGVTFNRFFKKHWIGFDCAHSNDYVPSTEKFKKENEKLNAFALTKEFKKYSLFNPVYRNVDFCIKECVSLIDQLIDLEKNK